MGIKKHIIHCLGGMTRREASAEYVAGSHDMCIQIREKAKDLNGLDPSEWCNAMWLYLNLTMDNCKKRHDEHRHHDRE